MDGEFGVRGDAVVNRAGIIGGKKNDVRGNSQMR